VRKYSPEIIAEVLAANDIVDILGAFLELKPAGSQRYKALCPFHTEKTPSFVVNRNRQSWHCFGCDKGGDAIGFLREYEGLTFLEALERLADRGGVRLPAMKAGDDKTEYRRKQLLEFCAFAAKFYEGMLQDTRRGSAARQYLQSRKLKEETIARFGLGYVPEAWSCLRDAAVKAGYHAAVLEASGFFKQGSGGSQYDFFRNRVMFPIRNTGGKVVAFGGRDLGDSPAKYINSPETPVYRKSRTLYALDQAKQAMMKAGSAFLVEGYFDALRFFDAGIDNVTATCGTALTPGQASLIRRYASEVIVVYDGDPAGIKAALRGISVLTQAGLAVRLMALPDGKDPDDFIRDEGPETFLNMAGNAPDFATFYVAMSRGRTGSIEGRTEVARELFAIIRDMNDRMRAEEYLKLLAEELGLSEWACRREYEEFLRRPAAPRMPKEPEPEEPEIRISREDTEFIAALLNEDRCRELAREHLRDIALEPGPMADVIETVLAGPDGAAAHQFENAAARRLFSAAASTETEPGEKTEKRVLKRLNRIEQDALRGRAAKLQEEIQEAERNRDTTRIGGLFTEKVRIEQRIRQLGAA
jgi:DNA primase